MSELKRIILTPYFGKLPEWFDKFEPPVGYEWILDTDLEKFKQRVGDILGIKCPIEYGSSKVWDYRCSLGLLYKEEIKGFDYWSTMDFDVVFGDVNKFFPDEELIKWDVWSNHDAYVAGFWSLYRNCPEVNELFLSIGFFQEVLENPVATGWVEDYYSRKLEASGLRYKYSGDLQGDPYHPPFSLIKENGRLAQFHHTDNDEVLAYYSESDYIIHKASLEGKYFVYKEIPMLHFRRSKKWPL